MTRLLLLLCALLAVLHVPSPTRAEIRDPWKALEVCRFGMPFLGTAVMPGESGYIMQIFNAVYQPEHVRFEHTSLPYNRAMAEVRKGTVDCTLVVPPIPDFPSSRSVIHLYDLSVAYGRNTPFTGVRSLSGERVAVLYGFDLGSLLSVPINAQRVFDLSSAFHMLEREYVRFIMDDKGLLTDALKESHLRAYDFKIKLLKTYEVRVLFAATEKGRRYRDIFDRRMAEMIEDGELREVLLGAGFTPEAVDRLIRANAP